MRFNQKTFNVSRHSIRQQTLPRWRSRAIGVAFAAAFLSLAVRAFWVHGINDDCYQK
jgi:cell division protein FtsI (penicillin-binding protein 3)